MKKIIIKSKDDNKIIKIGFEGTPMIVNLKDESISAVVPIEDIEPINCGFFTNVE